MTHVSRSTEHARMVHNVTLRGMPTPFDSMVLDSWRRCLVDNQLEPHKWRRAHVVERSDLRRRRQQSDVLLRIAKVEMSGLTRLLNASVGVMLTDADGVILSYDGSADFAEVAARSGLREGAIWSEAEQGTNGMGTCLTLRRPVLIQENQHFLYQNTALTCCGGPIFDGTGAIIGALNISGRLQLSAAPTLALVQLAVQNIENRVLLAQHRDHHVLRFHPHREFIGTASEGIVAIDDRGRVAGANHNALNWLGIEGHAALQDADVAQLFDCDFERLQALGEHPLHARPLPWRSTGTVCYSVMQPPPVSHTRSAGPPETALERAEREALKQLLQACNWNVSEAARQLRISRRTLHRKLKTYRLHRYQTSLS